MKKRIIAVICCLAILVAVSMSGCSKESPTVDSGGKVAAREFGKVFEISHEASDYSDFAVNLFKSCYDKDGNTLVSPLSVVMALAMASEGAEGDTLKELEGAMGMDIATLRAFAYSYMTEKAASGQLSTANAMWINKYWQDFYVDDEFVKTNKDFYNAEVFESVFSSDTIDAINKWVNSNTDGMIPEIIKSLDKETVMVLVNALLFEADWAEPYSEHQVFEGEFITEDNVVQKAEFLSNMEGCYLEGEDYKGFVKYLLLRQCSPMRV